jgi:hypothetical protein
MTNDEILKLLTGFKYAKVNNSIIKCRVLEVIEKTSYSMDTMRLSPFNKYVSCQIIPDAKGGNNVIVDASCVFDDAESALNAL